MNKESRTTPPMIAFTAAISIFLLAFAFPLAGQEVSASNPFENGSTPTNTHVVTTIPLIKRETRLATTSRDVSSTSAAPQNADDTWHMEIRPYVWAAGMYGRLRVRNLTVDTSKSSESVLGMLDFAAAAQVEAKKNRWSIIIDENYVNLGTTASGPLGVASVRVEPTLNLLEAGASYEFVRVNNKDASSSDPLPSVFSAEVHGGLRYIHFSLSLEPQNFMQVEGAKNLVGVFVGNRIKVRPHKAVTVVGEYTVGTSGVGSQFAWSADVLVDLRLKKSFSLGGGYRWLGLNIDNPDNLVGFDGQMRGLMLTFTLFR